MHHIKNVYNFDLAKSDVNDCNRFRGKDENDQRIILTLKNAITKSELISKVIKTDKKNGMNLNINEYLSTNNANLLYKLRCLRKEHKNKIFSCFSRNGFVFYKAQKDSRPQQILREEDIAQLSTKLQQSMPLRAHINTQPSGAQNTADGPKCPQGRWINLN